MSRGIARISRWTGMAYLGIIATGIFAEVGVRQALVVEGDAVATTANIAASAALFRLGILADVAMVGFDVAVAIGLFALLRRVDEPLAQLAAALRLIQAAVISANLMNMTRAVQLATGRPEALEGVIDGLVLASMDLHGVVYDLGLVFFGLACLALGRLLHASQRAPAVLGVALGAAGCVYLLGSWAALCAPEWSGTLDPLYGVAFVVELAFAGWLATAGLRTDRAGSTAGASTS